MMEVTTMLNYLMLRLRMALQEPWLDDATVLRRVLEPVAFPLVIFAKLL